jgi:hypothetical protein
MKATRVIIGLAAMVRLVKIAHGITDYPLHRRPWGKSSFTQSPA